MTTEWKVGDILRILDIKRVIGVGISQNGIYDVTAVDPDGTPIIAVEGGYGDLGFELSEMPYVERVFYNEATTARNVELGEPSPECNCEALTDIREELTDIKAMIGRLLRNGGDTE